MTTTNGMCVSVLHLDDTGSDPRYRGDVRTRLKHDGGQKMRVEVVLHYLGLADASPPGVRWCHALHRNISGWCGIRINGRQVTATCEEKRNTELIT